MVTRRMVTGALVMILMLAALSVAVPQTSLAQAAGDKTMWCNVPNEQFYQLCQDKQFMQALTPAQRDAIDKEWQRRVPNMTPAEVQKYYPAGTRYGSSMGAGG